MAPTGTTARGRDGTMTQPNQRRGRPRAGPALTSLVALGTQGQPIELDASPITDYFGRSKSSSAPPAAVPPTLSRRRGGGPRTAKAAAAAAAARHGTAVLEPPPPAADPRSAAAAAVPANPYRTSAAAAARGRSAAVSPPASAAVAANPYRTSADAAVAAARGRSAAVSHPAWAAVATSASRMAAAAASSVARGTPGRSSGPGGAVGTPPARGPSSGSGDGGGSRGGGGGVVAWGFSPQRAAASMAARPVLGGATAARSSLGGATAARSSLGGATAARSSLGAASRASLGVSSAGMDSLLAPSPAWEGRHKRRKGNDGEENRVNGTSRPPSAAGMASCPLMLDSDSDGGGGYKATGGGRKRTSDGDMRRPAADGTSGAQARDSLGSGGSDASGGVEVVVMTSPSPARTQPTGPKRRRRDGGGSSLETLSHGLLSPSQKSAAAAGGGGVPESPGIARFLQPREPRASLGSSARSAASATTATPSRPLLEARREAEALEARAAALLSESARRAASAAARRPAEPTTASGLRLALVQVDDPRVFSLDAPPGRALHVLRPNAILGRSDPTAAAGGINKIDLGISNDADGVSRRLLRVLDVVPEPPVEPPRGGSGSGARAQRRPTRPYVTFRLFRRAMQTVRGYHFDPGSSFPTADGRVPHAVRKHKYDSDPRKKRKEGDFLNAQDEFYAEVGDVLQLDSYTRKDGSGARYRFRLVLCPAEGESPAGAAAGAKTAAPTSVAGSPAVAASPATAGSPAAAASPADAVRAALDSWVAERLAEAELCVAPDPVRTVGAPAGSAAGGAPRAATPPSAARGPGRSPQRPSSVPGPVRGRWSVGWADRKPAAAAAAAPPSAARGPDRSGALLSSAPGPVRGRASTGVGSAVVAAAKKTPTTDRNVHDVHDSDDDDELLAYDWSGGRRPKDAAAATTPPPSSAPRRLLPSLMTPAAHSAVPPRVARSAPPVSQKTSPAPSPAAVSAGVSPTARLPVEASGVDLRQSATLSAQAVPARLPIEASAAAKGEIPPRAGEIAGGNAPPTPGATQPRPPPTVRVDGEDDVPGVAEEDGMQDGTQMTTGSVIPSLESFTAEVEADIAAIMSAKIPPVAPDKEGKGTPVGALTTEGGKEVAAVPACSSTMVVPSVPPSGAQKRTPKRSELPGLVSTTEANVAVEEKEEEEEQERGAEEPTKAAAVLEASKEVAAASAATGGSDRSNVVVSPTDEEEMRKEGAEDFGAQGAGAVNCAPGSLSRSLAPPGPVVKVPEPPRVGDRVRIEFEWSGLFSSGQPEWYFGTVASVGKVGTSARRLRYRLRVSYDEGATGEVEFPAEDVQRLLPPDTELRSRKSKGCVCAQPVDGTGDPVVAYDPNPLSLGVGDLVECRYQDGAKWYRGRIARLSDDRDRFDVAYYDGEYERDVLFLPGNARLIARGSCPATWLRGLQFDEPVDNPKSEARNKQRRGRVIGVAEAKTDVIVLDLLHPRRNQRAMLTVQYGDGPEESVPYEDVAAMVLAAHREECLSAGKVKAWPGAEGKEGGKPVPHVKPSPADFSLEGQTDGGGEDAPPPVPKGGAKDARKRCRPRKRGPKDEANEPERPESSKGCFHLLSSAKSEESNVVSPNPETDEEDSCCDDFGFGALDLSQDSPSAAQPPRKIRAKEIHPSLGNSLWRALNSAEPHAGSTLLRHELSVHATVPNQFLSNGLWDLVRDGPKSEGIAFRDPNRTELGQRYLSLLLAEQGFWRSPPDSKAAEAAWAAFGPQSWEILEHILRAPIADSEDMSAGDFSAPVGGMSPLALRRMGQALQVARCGLWCFLELLRRDLADAIKGGGGARGAGRVPLSAGAMMRVIRDRSVREALKLTARCAAICWVRHGHWVIGGPSGHGPGRTTNVGALEQFCADGVRQCLDHLGCAICYLAWLYCVDEGLGGVGDDQCAFAVRDAVLSELDRASDNSGDCVAPERQRFSKRLNLRFVLSLSEEFAAPLQPRLAEMLGVSEEFFIATGSA